MTRAPGRRAAPLPRDEQTAWVGMVIFLSSWAMLFAALFFSYGVLRLRLAAWPPPGAPRLPVGLAVASTLVLLASSLLLERDTGHGLTFWRLALPMPSAAGSEAPLPRWASLRASAGTRSPKRLAGALALGFLFLAVQGLLWWTLLSRGLHWGDGTLASVVYGLIAFHAAHVVVGLIGLTWAWWSSQVPNRLSALPVSLRLWAIYWHFVGVVWVLVLFFVFIL